MKKTSIFLAFLVFTINTFAQKGNKRFQKIEALKIAYITNALDLTSKEAEQFWPIYNTYSKALHQIRKQLHKNKKRPENPDLTDAEALELIQQMTAFKEQELALNKKLIKDLLPILSAKKILLLKHAEQQFKRELLHRLKQAK